MLGVRSSAVTRCVGASDKTRQPSCQLIYRTLAISVGEMVDIVVSKLMSLINTPRHVSAFFANFT